MILKNKMKCWSYVTLAPDKRRHKMTHQTLRPVHITPCQNVFAVPSHGHVPMSHPSHVPSSCPVPSLRLVSSHGHVPMSQSSHVPLSHPFVSSHPSHVPSFCPISSCSFITSCCVLSSCHVSRPHVPRAIKRMRNTTTCINTKHHKRDTFHFVI